MLIFVIIFNLSLTLVNVYILLKIREWNKNLKTTTKVLTNVEDHVHRGLNPAPKWVMIGQKGTHNFRFRLEIFTHQLKMIENLLKLLIWLSQKTMVKTSIQLKK